MKHGKKMTQKRMDEFIKIVNKTLKSYQEISEKNRQGINNEVRQMMQEKKKKNKERHKQYGRSRKQKHNDKEEKDN